MQDYLDSKYEEVKIISNFEFDKEKAFLETSVYEFYFHLWVKSNNGEKGH